MHDVINMFSSLLIKWRFTKRVEKQMDAFLVVCVCVILSCHIIHIFFKGLSNIIPLRQLRVFDERELEVSFSLSSLSPTNL